VTFHDIQKTVGDFLLNWQTLIAGLLALLGALLTILLLRNQAREAAERKSRGARVMLPAALDTLTGYVIDSVRWLDSVREKADLSEKGAYRHSIPVNTPPRPDPGMLTVFRDCVESVDIKHVRIISDLVSKIQIQNAWISSLNDYFVNYPLYETKRFGLSGEIDEASVKSILLVAIANQLFPYARLQTDALPPPLDLRAVRMAMRACHLEEINHVNVFNALTDPYIKAEHASGVYMYQVPEPAPEEDEDV